MRLGGGSHTYEIVEGWGQLPGDVRFGYTHGVVVDSQDRVYVFNQSKDAIIVFDQDGRFVQSWGEKFKKGAHGMFLNREGDREYLYLTDSELPAVVKTTLDGDEVLSLDPPDLPTVYQRKDQYKPTGIAVAPNGDIYVCDGYGENLVHRYNSEGEWVRSWGTTGSQPGQMDCPHGIWVDTRKNVPMLLVADRANIRIQMFTLDGEHKEFITEELRYPCSFYQFGDELYIPDLRGRLTIFDQDNKLITHLGDNPGIWEKEGWPNIPPEKRTPGKFISPHATCVDSNRDIYVVEWIPDGRLTKLRRVNGGT